MLTSIIGNLILMWVTPDWVIYVISILVGIFMIIFGWQLSLILFEIISDEKQKDVKMVFVSILGVFFLLIGGITSVVVFVWKLINLILF